MKDSFPLISVVVPTCDRNDLLSRCLDSLAGGAQTLSRQRFEVIVSDDGATGGAGDLVTQRYPWARWAQGPGRGPAANRNHGVTLAGFEWIAFIDDDCIADPEWLEAYADSALSHGDSSVLEGRVYADRPRRSLAETAPINETGGYLWSCNFMIRASLFKKMKGFDERFVSPAMEDVDLRRRLADNGHKPVFVPEAAVCHPWRKANGWRGIRAHGDATLTYLSIHPDELSHINSKFYLRWFVRSLLCEILIDGIRYRGAGLRTALLQSAGQIHMALRLKSARSKPSCVA